METPAPHRSRAEIILLWVQLVLVVGGALAISQGWVETGPAPGWATLLPLAGALPAAAAFRQLRIAAWGVAGVATASLAVLAWLGGGLLTALAACWPLLLAGGLLLGALRVRADREREASRLHRHTRANLAELEESEACGCIACERIYFPSEVVGWLPDGTALCPHCGVDAVVGSASGIPITPGVLRRAHMRWFLVG